MTLRPPTFTLFPYTTLFRSFVASPIGIALENLEGRPPFASLAPCSRLGFSEEDLCRKHCVEFPPRSEDTRLNSSHRTISYAVFCLKKKKKIHKKNIMN